MKWYEYIIIIISIGLVVLPIYLSIINRKKGNKCSSNCCCCSNKDNCYKNFKQFIEEHNKNKNSI